MISTLLKTLVCILLTVGLIDEVSGFKIDEPERVRKQYQIRGSTSLILTHIGYKSFIYVVEGERRVWKSPQLSNYFCIEKDSQFCDLDKNGVPDFVLQYGECKLMCEFGVFIGLNMANQNFVFHYSPERRSSAGHSSKSKVPLLESSTPAPPELWINMKDVLRRSACDDNSRDNINRIITDRLYSSMQPDSDSFRELRGLYLPAKRSLRRGEIKNTLEKLEYFFDIHDYRNIDPHGKDTLYTTILEDYGSSLLHAGGGFDKTLQILSFVIEREPTRSSPYLQLGDLFYRYAPTLEQAKISYRKYHDLMVKSGKKNLIPKRVLERI